MSEKRVICIVPVDRHAEGVCAHFGRHRLVKDDFSRTCIDCAGMVFWVDKTAEGYREYES